MAGNPDSLVRPKGAQDSQRIVAGSPLAVQGVFIEVLRERFSEAANLDMVWDPDPTLTGVLVEAAYNEETDSRSETPALYVERLQAVPIQVVTGDRAGVRLRDHFEGFYCLMQVDMQIECVANDRGVSAVLGDIVHWMLLASSDVIQRHFGFRDLAKPILGETVPFERAQTKWNTPITFQVQYEVRWAQLPIAPLLQQIGQRVNMSNTSTSEEYFHETTLDSLRRASPDDEVC